MKTIILIRHAKASQEFGTKDFDRHIVPIGIQNTISVSQKFDFQINAFSEIWCSSAKRTSQTAVLFSENSSLNLDLIQFKKELYTFSLTDLGNSIQTCSKQTENLIIFGHNNALTDFANQFGDQYISNIPTSGLVIIQFQENDWSFLKKGKTLKTIFPSHE